MTRTCALVATGGPHFAVKRGTARDPCRFGGYNPGQVFAPGEPVTLTLPAEGIPILAGGTA